MPRYCKDLIFRTGPKLLDDAAEIEKEQSARAYGDKARRQESHLMAFLQDPYDEKPYVYIRNHGFESKDVNLRPSDKIERGLIRVCEAPEVKVTPKYIKSTILPRIAAIQGDTPPMIKVDEAEIRATTGWLGSKLKEARHQVKVGGMIYALAHGTSYLINGAGGEAAKFADSFLDLTGNLWIVPAVLAGKLFIEAVAHNKVSPEFKEVNIDERAQGVFRAGTSGITRLMGMATTSERQAAQARQSLPQEPSQPNNLAGRAQRNEHAPSRGKGGTQRLSA